MSAQKQTTPNFGLDTALDERLMDAIKSRGIEQMTPVQKQAIPALLEGKDVRVCAPTGTGKTLAFLAPILQYMITHKTTQQYVRALILTPTRELAMQVHERAQAYAKRLPFKSVVVYGGVRIAGQITRLRRRRDILVATPGRLLDLVSQGAVCLKQVECLALDEADRMLDMGFMPDIERIIALLPYKRQNMLFSATYSAEMKQMAESFLKQPVCIEVAPKENRHALVRQCVYPVETSRKAELLTHLIAKHQWLQVLVFVKTKRGADQLCNQLNLDGMSAAAIHGDLSQGKRTRTLAEFKKLKTQVLVATDVAARGLDIHDLACVINFDLPQVAEDYVHRIGRTGRAGRAGLAIALVSPTDVRLLRAVERYLKITIEQHDEADFAVSLSQPKSKKQRTKSGKRSSQYAKKAPHKAGRYQEKSKQKKFRQSDGAGTKTSRPPRRAETDAHGGPERSSPSHRKKAKRSDASNQPFAFRDDAQDHQGRRKKLALARRGGSEKRFSTKADAQDHQGRRKKPATAWRNQRKTSAQPNRHGETSDDFKASSSKPNKFTKKRSGSPKFSADTTQKSPSNSRFSGSVKSKKTSAGPGRRTSTQKANHSAKRAKTSHRPGQSHVAAGQRKLRPARSATPVE